MIPRWAFQNIKTTERIKVAVRVRPMHLYEGHMSQVVKIDKEATSVYVYDEISLNDIRASYDEVFDGGAT